jgi:hypothetical protein
MGGRSSTTFAKLQKERSRREKQAEKEQRRRQRSMDKKAGIPRTYADDIEESPGIAEPSALPDAESNL